jgi:3'-5' exoribonuclease
LTKKSPSDFVENLKTQRSINSQFAIVHKIIRTASSGRNYLDITLTDKTGRIDGRMFPDDNIEGLFNSINTGSICEIRGTVTEFPPGSGKVNIVINSLTELCDDDYHLEDFIKTSDNDKEKLIKEIRSVIKNMENPHLKNLLKSFFCDKSFTDEFYQAPAAMIHHHNYLGGLLDHSVEVLLICQRLCELFPQLDPDLLYTGALLHDLGKIKAYDYDAIKIEMSQDSILVDHIFRTAYLVKEKMNSLQFPEKLSQQVLHLILSHHGKVRLGWGSTVNPKLPEAVALHHADNLDARVKEMFPK